MIRSFLPIVLISISINVYSQLDFGIKTGLNLSRIHYNTDTSKSRHPYGFSPSFHFGVYGNVDVSDKLFFSAEFLLSDKGFKEGSAYHLLYATIPVTANFRVIENLSVGVGPELGILITQWGTDREYLAEIYSNRLDIGVVAGFQYLITSKVGVVLRLEQGLSNIIGRNATGRSYSYIQGGDPMIVEVNLRDRGIVHRNQNFQLSLCYKLISASH